MATRVRRLVLVPLAAALAVLVLADAPAQVKKDMPRKDTPKAKDAAKAGAVVFEVYADRGGDFRFRLKSGDTILAVASRGYATKDECRKVVEEIKAEAGRARITEPPADDKAKQ
jgi:uncharacterized protein YegP (UPF0339 family)